MDLDTLINRLTSLRQQHGNIKIAVNGDRDNLWRPLIVKRRAVFGGPAEMMAIISFRGCPTGYLPRPLPWT